MDRKDVNVMKQTQHTARHRCIVEWIVLQLWLKCWTEETITTATAILTQPITTATAIITQTVTQPRHTNTSEKNKVKYATLTLVVRILFMQH